jgi:transketolase
MSSVTAEATQGVVTGKLTDVNDLKEMATQIRRDIIRMLMVSQSGHTGGPLGMTDIFTALWFNKLKLDREHFLESKDQDFFFLSNGHIVPVWYATLARAGYFPLKELSTLRALGSRLQGHPATDTHLVGIRIASGSLGQGLSAAIGAALGLRIDKNPNRVFCLMGDGETQEGQIWEAAMAAAHHKVDHLIGIVDYNGMQIDGETKRVMSVEPFADKWHSFGWHVLTIEGNDMQAILTGIDAASQNLGSGKPTVILAKTIMGKGVPFFEGLMPDGSNWHGKTPSKELGEKALAVLGTTKYGDF